MAAFQHYSSVTDSPDREPTPKKTLPRRRAPRRYQLNKAATAAVRSGHPWVYRKHISSAAEGFADGQWLELVDASNVIVGFGSYERSGAIGLRVVRRGDLAPDGAWVVSQVDAALDKRRSLRRKTEAFRAIHGENDGLPGVVFDVFGNVGVLQTFAAGADGFGRLCATHVRRRLGLDAVIWRPSPRRHGDVPRARTLFGAPPPVVRFREAELEYAVDVREGQKTGAYLDLRGLRRYIRSIDSSGKRVLNLFAFAGASGVAAEAAGAREIWHVDASERALEFGRTHHVDDEAKHRWVRADVFEWLQELDPAERFDLVVVDPPQMTSRADQVRGVLRAYERLLARALAHVAPGGTLVACCCTSRVSRRQFRTVCDSALGKRMRFVERIPAETDHPVAFDEGEYLKMLVYRDLASAS